MTKARSEQIDLDATPFYHCYVRCVRRAYLCGDDALTGENYDHRKQWIVSRLRFLSYVYAIDLCAYAVMSNHYHVVLHVDRNRAKGWSDHDVAERWMQIYKGHLLVDRWLQSPESFSRGELDAVREIIDGWRERLSSIEWFMRGVNETIARMANEEEDCRGRFWEGRYKSQALLDDAALLSCMAYVDLNPVRAGMAESMELSDYTSIQQRIYDYVREHKNAARQHSDVKQAVKRQQAVRKEIGLADLSQAALKPFDGSAHTSLETALPFTFADYMALVDTTGRAIRDDKKGYIAEKSPRLIQQLNIDPDRWLDHIQHFGRSYGNGVGSVESLAAFAAKRGRGWVKGVGQSRRCRLCRVG